MNLNPNSANRRRP